MLIVKHAHLLGDPRQAMSLHRNHDHITSNDMVCIDDARRFQWVVFCAFDRIAQRMIATGDDANNHRWVSAKRRRALAGVEHAQSSRCAGPDI